MVILQGPEIRPDFIAALKSIVADAAPAASKPAHISFFIRVVLGGVFLVAGSIDDLRSRRIRIH